MTTNETKAAGAVACEDIERIRRAASRINHPLALCGFLGKGEMEVMVASTIRACVHNYEQTGDVFSIPNSRLKVDGGYGLCENRVSYGALLKGGYLIEAERGGEAVIKPTVMLLDRLEAFFEREDGGR